MGSRTGVIEKDSVMATTQRPGTVDHVDETSGWSRNAPYVWASTRISLGWVFLWAFLDKAFGLAPGDRGGERLGQRRRPTKGFLSLRRHRPVRGHLQGHRRRHLGRLAVHDRSAGIGVALILGIAMRIAAATGALLIVLKWTAVLPPENNLFMDDHLIYATVLHRSGRGERRRHLGSRQAVGQHRAGPQLPDPALTYPHHGDWTVATWQPLVATATGMRP